MAVRDVGERLNRGRRFDASNARIQKFDGTETFLLTWGSSGTGRGQFSVVGASITVDGNGLVYVADTSNDRIQQFDGTGTFLTEWGSTGLGTGQFRGPTGIAVDASGNVFVADESDHQIQKFACSPG
jgi:DNA-binding beta-propeller fold protein YncE